MSDSSMCEKDANRKGFVEDVWEGSKHQSQWECHLSSQQKDVQKPVRQRACMQEPEPFQRRYIQDGSTRVEEPVMRLTSQGVNIPT